jgi:hypothetical protein
VTVEGRVERSSSGAPFRGWVVYGGRSLDEVRRVADEVPPRLRMLGRLLVGAGLGLLGVYAYGLRRARRREA